MRLLERAAADEFRARIEVMGREIQDPDLVERRWIDFCRKNQHLYFSILRGHGRIRRGLNRLLGFSDRMYSKSAVAILENVIRCQAHREVLSGILQERRRAIGGKTKQG